MKKLVSLLTAALFSVSLLLSLTSCGDSREKIYVLSYGEYIGEGVLDKFEAEYPQYRVVYDESATPEEMYQKLSGGVPYDVLVCSDYIIEKMIKENILKEIDKTKLSNYQYVDEQLRGGLYDPEGKYAVPYMWGTLGIIYNTKLVTEPVDSWSILWDEKYAGKIQVLDSQRDSMAMALRYCGYSINSTNENEINEALAALKTQKTTMHPVIGVDDLKAPMAAGQYALTVEYSGDAMELMDQNEDLAYAVPKEGSNIWVDALIMPTTGKNEEGAYAYIDFMCRSDIALENTEYIMYSTPLTTVADEIGDEFKQNPAFNPPAETVARCEYYDDLGDALSLYNKAWEDYRLN